MYKLPLESIDGLKEGDIFYVETCSAHDVEHSIPNVMAEDVAAVNPFEGPYWIRVKGGATETGYLVRMQSVESAPYSSSIVEKSEPVEYLLREAERVNKDIWNNDREEAVEWDGTPQSRMDARHNNAMDEGDIRGDKNDLL